MSNKFVTATSKFLNKIKTAFGTAFSKMGPLAAKLKPVAIVVGNTLKRAAISTWSFVKTPQGMSICLISALTIAFPTQVLAYLFYPVGVIRNISSRLKMLCNNVNVSVIVNCIPMC